MNFFFSNFQRTALKLARTKWPRQGGKKISLTFDERIVRVVIAKYTSDEVIGTLHKQIGFCSIGHSSSQCISYSSTCRFN